MMNEKLLANVRHYFAQTVFMTSIHFKAYNRINKRKKQISNIVLGIASATVMLLILQVIAIENQSAGLIRVVTYIGLLATAISLIVELFCKEDLSFLMCQHKIYGEKYKTLRDEYMSLIEEIMSQYSTDEHFHTKRDYLQLKYSEIGEVAPETTAQDYSQAQKGLGLTEKSGEEFTWCDDDIDIFLPERLRLKH